eukprot:CAMPEP_0176026922 /NCGR_PEP_ID=MMETSP0120_2-20121206/13197_1 /TAXON_ID=160619 /ORGANISM="Kryptoperidinium foliaceum, Strain CCMP 1326" /LENGTH=573 /DNA_ID=CAMNT_0017360127 /DNA_START=1 /DNA_END=1722 /DNA_ORIENTATION=-
MAWRLACLLLPTAYAWRASKVIGEDKTAENHRFAAPEALLERGRSGFPVNRHLAQLLPVLPAAELGLKQPRHTEPHIAQQTGTQLHESGRIWEQWGSGDEDNAEGRSPGMREGVPPRDDTEAASSRETAPAAPAAKQQQGIFDALATNAVSWIVSEFEKTIAKQRENKLVLDGVMNFAQFFFQPDLPQDWEQIVSASGLRLVCKTKRSKIFTGKYISDEDFRIALKVMSTKNPETQNEIQMMKRLRSSGNVISYLASEELPDLTYLLMPEADGTLESYLKQRRALTGQPLKPLLSLGILVDLLRGIRDLNQQRIVHCALTESDVLMKDGRPLIADFGMATVVPESETNFGHGTVGPCKLPFVPGLEIARVPPETFSGVPTGPSNNVYQVGAIFAYMTLGYVPMLRGLPFSTPEADDIASWDPQVDEKAQNMIRQNFSITEDPGFQQLDDEDIKRLLEGMLAVDLEKRWDAVGALEEAMAVADRRGILIPPERSPADAALCAVEERLGVSRHSLLGPLFEGDEGDANLKRRKVAGRGSAIDVSQQLQEVDVHASFVQNLLTGVLAAALLRGIVF